jgi:hypothetical protein
VSTSDEPSRIDAILEAIEPWRNAALMIGIVGVLLVAFQMPEARTPIAHGLMYGFGALLALLAWTRVRDGSAALSVSWLVLAIAVCGAGAYAAHRGIEPGAPIDSAEVRVVGDVAELDVPQSDAPFRLRVQAELEGSRHENTRAPYQLYLSRGDADLRVRGELYREVREEAGRGGPPKRTISVHRTELHDLSLGGRGPAAVSPMELESIEGPLELAVFPPFGLAPWWIALLSALVVVSVVLEVISARAQAWAPLTAVTGLTLVLGEYVALRYDVDQPLITLLGGAVFSGVVGGVGGLVVGIGATWLARRLGA